MTGQRRQVKITGVGPVTPAGTGRNAFYRGINQPVSRVRQLELRPLEEISSMPGFSAKEFKFVGASVQGFRLADYGMPDRRLPRQTQFALAGTKLALADAGLRPSDLAGMNPSISCGSALMDSALHNLAIESVSARGPGFAHPLIVFDAPVAAIGGKIGAVLDTQFRSFTIQTACCAGIDAIGHGAEMIASGQSEIAFCCGTEAPLCFHPMLEFGKAGLSPRNTNDPEKLARPFDLWRTCGVIGEGAGVLILEPEESPRPALAWVDGYAFGNDSIEGLAGNGLGDTMRMALANARRRPGEVDLIFAWGPGHELIDRVEAAALSDVFGNRLEKIPAVSSKGAIGTAFAAGSAIQAISAALSLRTGVIPPTVNWQAPDPECPLNLFAEAREIGFKLAVVNAHGVCGTNATLVLRRA